ESEPEERARGLAAARALLDCADEHNLPLARLVAGLNIIAAAALVHMDSQVSRQEVRERVLFTRRQRFDHYVGQLHGLFMALLGPSAVDASLGADLRPVETLTTRSE